MAGSKVSVVKYRENDESIRKSLEYSGAWEVIEQIRPSDRVLLKPNLVMWDNVYPFPKYGVLTTSVVVEEMVKILAEAGCSNIIIGEAAVENSDMGAGTNQAFEGLGYSNLQKKYGVNLVDLNESDPVNMETGNYNLKAARETVETDYLINIPVLKTHNATRVSLGFKNLKGCLHHNSKKFCHHREASLEQFISCLGEKLYPDITLIDGIFTLERGPVVNGTAHRSDLLIASRDMFSADIIGSYLLGFSPEEIGHLKDYAQRKSLSMDLDEIEIIGESLEENRMKLKWDWGWKQDNSGPTAFERVGITGINYPKYDNTICSGCSFLNNFVLVLLMGAYDGTPFPQVEFLMGKNMLSRGGYQKSFLLGNCMIRANRDNSLINESVPVKGCPPKEKEVIRALNENGIPASIDTYRYYRQSLYQRYQEQEEFKEDFFWVE